MAIMYTTTLVQSTSTSETVHSAKDSVARINKTTQQIVKHSHLFNTQSSSVYWQKNYPENLAFEKSISG